MARTLLTTATAARADLLVLERLEVRLELLPASTKHAVPGLVSSPFGDSTSLAARIGVVAWMAEAALRQAALRQAALRQPAARVRAASTPWP